MRGNRTGIISALLLGAVLVLGVSQLFVLRFEAGDIYPPYSSLRSDPLGTRVLYDGLASCVGTTVSRCFEPLTRVDLEALPSNTALLFLGDYLPTSEYASVSRESANRLSAFMRRGGRVVVTLQPTARESEEDYFLLGGEEDEDGDADDSEEEETDAADEGEDEGKDEGKDEEEEEDLEVRWDEQGVVPVPTPRSDRAKTVRLKDWLNVGIAFVTIEEAPTATATVWAVEEGLPNTVTCRTTRCFCDLTEDWRVLYERDGNPVVIERPWGDGALVLSAPGYFVSNEALRRRRRTPLLLWLIGDSTTVVFDEHHHGIQTPQGVVMLARRYRLHWFGAGLVLLALLFVWQSASSLVPPYESAARGPAVEFSPGKDSVSGLVNLLRRNIARRHVLDACIDEWKRSAPHTAADTARKLAAMRKIADAESAKPRKERNIARAYNRIAAFLHERQTLNVENRPQDDGEEKAQ